MALALGLFGHAFLESDNRLVDLNGLAFAANGRELFRAHGLANAMAHEPCGLVGHAKHTAELMAGNALLAAGQEMGRIFDARLTPDTQMRKQA